MRNICEELAVMLAHSREICVLVVWEIPHRTSNSCWKWELAANASNVPFLPCYLWCWGTLLIFIQDFLRCFVHVLSSSLQRLQNRFLLNMEHSWDMDMKDLDLRHSPVVDSALLSSVQNWKKKGTDNSKPPKAGMSLSATVNWAPKGMWGVIVVFTLVFRSNARALW